MIDFDNNLIHPVNKSLSLSSKCLATLQYCHPFNCKVMLGAAPQNSIAVQ